MQQGVTLTIILTPQIQHKSRVTTSTAVDNQPSSFTYRVKLVSHKNLDQRFRPVDSVAAGFRDVCDDIPEDIELWC